MKKRLKLKKFVMPTVYTLLASLFLVISFVAFRSTDDVSDSVEEIQFVSNSVLSNDMPVMSTTKIVIRPYNVENVKIGN